MYSPTSRQFQMIPCPRRGASSSSWAESLTPARWPREMTELQRSGIVDELYKVVPPR